jgi:hypothetical protein
VGFKFPNIFFQEEKLFPCVLNLGGILTVLRGSFDGCTVDICCPKELSEV